MILIKQHNSHHVARLYMHLFCMAVDNFFYDKRLFPYLDYDLSTRVVRGVVYVHVRLHTTEAKQLSKELTKLKVPLDDASRTIAILQIAVDEQRVFSIAGDKEPDFEALKKELAELDARPWQGVDDVGLIEPAGNQLVGGAFYLPLDKKEFATRDVKVTISLHKSFAETHSELLPLFWHFAMLTSACIKSELYDQVGFYGTAISRRPKNRTTTLIGHYRAAFDVVQKLNDAQDIIDDVISDLGDSNVYDRMAGELKLALHNKSLPNPMYMHDRTGIIIGAKGWKRIATDKNCNLVLSHMKVALSAGRQRSSISISSILK